jgi:hypothetical protein
MAILRTAEEADLGGVKALGNNAERGVARSGGGVLRGQLDASQSTTPSPTVRGRGDIYRA